MPTAQTRVRKFKIAQSGRILSPFRARGYLRIKLCNGTGRKNYTLHRLIADAFLVKDCDRNVVNHKNGNRLDNRAENLEWVTTKENWVHAYTVLGRRNLVGVAKLTPDAVREIRQALPKRIFEEFSIKHKITPIAVFNATMGISWAEIEQPIAAQSA